MDLQQMLSLSYMHIGDISFMFLTEFFTGAKSEAGWLFRPGRKTGTWTSPRHAPTARGGVGNGRFEGHPAFFILSGGLAAVFSFRSRINPPTVLMPAIIFIAT
jgi:hypothetical protein